MTVFSAHCLCSICSSYRWYAWLTKLSISCFPLALRFVLHSSGIPQTIISIGRNTVCSNAVLLSPPNPLALQKWEWQNISVPWVPWGNAPHGHWSSPAHPPPSLHSRLLQQVLLVCSIGNGAEVSALGSVLEIKSQSRDWQGTGHQLWCSAPVLREGVEGPFSQGGFWAVMSSDKD